MLENNFSQIPITYNNNFVGLITTNTIARWIGQISVGDDDIFSSKETKISDVIEFAEYNNNYQFINRDTDVFEVLRCFYESVEKGIILDALLITHSSKKPEQIIGIITSHDLPKIIHESGI